MKENSWNDEQKKRGRTEGDFEVKISGAGSVAAAIGDGAHSGNRQFRPIFIRPTLEAAPVNRCARWLDIIKQANLGHIEDAEYLGWVAYNNGDYKGAAHWLELSKSDSGSCAVVEGKVATPRWQTRRSHKNDGAGGGIIEECTSLHSVHGG